MMVAKTDTQSKFTKLVSILSYIISIIFETIPYICEALQHGPRFFTCTGSLGRIGRFEFIQSYRQ